MTDIEQSMIGPVQSGLGRVRDSDNFILFGPNFGHRFPERPHHGDVVFCLLCKEPFDLETDSRIPVPSAPCPDHETNESEKSERTASYAYRIWKDAEELADDARRLFKQRLIEEHTPR